jgi:hypothetical protein
MNPMRKNIVKKLIPAQKVVKERLEEALGDPDK